MEDNMFYAKIVLHAWQTMQKSSRGKERRECWAVLSGNVTKLAQQTELQLAVILALHEHENTKVVFFTLQGDRPVAERILLVILT